MGRCPSVFPVDVTRSELSRRCALSLSDYEDVKREWCCRGLVSTKRVEAPLQVGADEE